MADPHAPASPAATVPIAGAEADPDVAALPRLLRHALNALRGPVAATVAAEIAFAAPAVAYAAEEWAEHPCTQLWRGLAATLDDAAATDGRPTLRDLADAVRIASMSVADAGGAPDQSSRLAQALHAAKGVAGRAGASASNLADVERLAVGWTALASGFVENDPSRLRSAHSQAYDLGMDLTEAIESAAAREADAPSDLGSARDVASRQAGDGVMVCPPIPAATRSAIEAVRAHSHVIGVTLPLAPTPDVAVVRRALAEEYPYASAAIDRLLSPLIGERWARLPPTLLVGPPGSGKSRLARRMSESLGLGLWRTDAARADSAAFGGADRRWVTSEACWPFLAVSRTLSANPVVLVDEIDKAGLGRRNGRIWDALHGFLERETARAYPDPALQVELDLSHVVYLLTCNDVGSLPASLVDRCRVVEVPSPSPRHLDRLLPSLLRGIARDGGLDERWVEPLTGAERAMVADHWRGGSVRRLERLVATVLRGRERHRPLH